MLKILLGLVVGLAVLVIAAAALVKSLVDEDYLAEKLEKSINSRVEIGDVSLSLFSSPARLSLSQVHLSPRDGKDKRAGVKIDQVELNVSFWQLFFHHIDISKITVKRAEITSVYFEDGSTSLGEMFRKPKRKKHRGAGGRTTGRDEGGFNVFDQKDFVTSLGGLVIEDSKVDITIEKTGLRIRGEDLRLVLSSIKVDPKNLRATNTARLTLNSLVRVHSTKGWHYGDLNLAGTASVRVFNPETGNTEPDIEGRIDLNPGSWLNTRVPVISSAWNSLSILEKVGVKVAKLPDRATFGRSRAVAAHYHKGKITVREPLSIWVGDWELAALAGSWLQTETDQHEIHAELLASVNASERFLRLIRALVKLVPKKAADLLVKDIEDKLFRDGRLIVKVKSSGDFSDPKVRPVDGVPDVIKEAKKAGKDALKDKAGDILRGLLDR